MKARAALGRSVRILLIVAMVVMLLPGAAVARSAPVPASPSAPAPDGAAAPPKDGLDSAPVTSGWAGGGSAADRGEYVEGQVLVRFKQGVVGTAAVTAAHATLGASVSRNVKGLSGLQLVKLKDGMSVEEAVKAYQAMPEVLSAQPNYTIRQLAGAPVIPDDPMFGDLWGLNNTAQDIMGNVGTYDADIDAPEAWATTTGSSDVVVAVMDTGVDYLHPDLASNMWMNPGEIASNGIDDDGNGYVDDVYGYDFINGDYSPMDDHGHGTHCAGTVGGSGDDGTGIVGVNWDVSIMALKIFDAGGYTTTDAIVEAFAYADMMGADVISCSWGGIGATDPAEEAAIAAVVDPLIVCAAGNDGVDTDSMAYYPAAYNGTNIISVGASTNTDAAASFSNYGATTVDLFAPGQDIWSSVPGSIYYDSLVGEPVTIFEDDFTDAAAWDTTDYITTPWALYSMWVNSAPYSFGCTNYGDNESSWAYSAAPLDLSAATHPVLDWRMGVHVQSGADYVYWGVYDESEDMHYPLGQYSGTTLTPFDFFEEDLTDFAGQSDIYPYFGLESDGAVSAGSGYIGGFIDDLRVVDDQFVSEVVFGDAFDADDGSWDVETYGATSWTWDPAVGYSAAGCWRVAPYGDYENTVLYSPPFDLEFGATLDFRLYSSIESGWDYFRVYAYSPAVGWRYIWSQSGYSPWNPVSISLAEFAGQDDVRLVFQFTSDGSINSAHGYPGVYIDDLTITSSAYAAIRDYSSAYECWSGTSMATPHVAGAAGLLLAREPDLTAEELKTALQDTVDTPAALAGLCVTNGRLNLATAMDAVNSIPVATDDAYSMVRNTALTMAAPGVLANDVDGNGDALMVTQLSDPTNGSLVLSANGAFTYTPNVDFTGTDSFTYEVTDGIDVSGVATVDITVTAGITTTIEDSAAGVTYGRFISASGAAFSGGGYAYSYSKGVYVGTRLEATFTGTSVRWIGPKQPNYGMAKVYIDGHFQQTVNCYAAPAQATLSAVIYESPVLAEGTHTILIEMVDGKDPASTGNVVVVDKFEADGVAPAGGGDRFGELSGTFLGGWVKVGGNQVYTDSSYAYSYWPGSRYIKTFTGTRVSWIGPKVNHYGRAAVYIDGVYQATVSQYAIASNTQFRAKVWESQHLPFGTHTLEIRPLGLKEPSSSGTVIVVDGIDVMP